MNDNNELDGFDVSVAKELASRMGVKAEFVTPSWDIMTAGHWAGRWDVVIGSMTPTKKRAEVLNFPAVYYFDPAAVAVHKTAKYTKVEELDGKRVAAVVASTYEAYLKHDLKVDVEGMPPYTYKITPAEIVPFTDINPVPDLALGDGVRMDGLVYSLSIINEAIRNGLPIKLLGEPVFYEPLAIATDKGDPELDALVAKSIKEMKEDGTLSKLSLKWHHIDLATVK